MTTTTKVFGKALDLNSAEYHLYAPYLNSIEGDIQFASVCDGNLEWEDLGWLKYHQKEDGSFYLSEDDIGFLQTSGPDAFIPSSEKDNKKEIISFFNYLHRFDEQVPTYQKIVSNREIVVPVSLPSSCNSEPILKDVIEDFVFVYADILEKNSDPGLCSDESVLYIVERFMTLAEREPEAVDREALQDMTTYIEAYPEILKNESSLFALVFSEISKVEAEALYQKYQNSGIPEAAQDRFVREEMVFMYLFMIQAFWKNDTP